MADTSGAAPELHKRRILRTLTRTFLTGLIVILPLAITAAVVVWVLGATERLLDGLVQLLIPDRLYFPGLGLIAAIGLVFGAGMLAQSTVFQVLYDVLDDVLTRIPLVKTVYGGVRDFMLFFSKRGRNRFSKVVLLEFPATPYRLVGFVTVEDFKDLKVDTDHDTVAVYLPMSYQIGGYTFLVPKKSCTPLDMSMEEAMRFVLTAGMSSASSPTGSAPAAPLRDLAKGPPGSRSPDDSR